MLAWLHPGLLVTVTTPFGARFVWFDDRFSVARLLDQATVARIMRLQKVRLFAIIAIAVLAFGWMAVAMLAAADPSQVSPLAYLVGFAIGSSALAAVFARAQRRHIDRQPSLTLPAESVARLAAIRNRSLFGKQSQYDVACKVAAELVYRTQ